MRPQPTTPQPLAECHERLEAAGIKPTHQRLVILQELVDANAHLSAEMVYERLRAQNPSLSLGTVYRTLDILADSGLIRRVSTDHGLKRFDANLSDHHHLVCNQTNEIMDYNDPELNDLLQAYFRRKCIEGFEVGHVQLYISGRKVPV
jgi:Fur family transcriptional regulator, peroxide stress response regulator